MMIALDTNVLVRYIVQDEPDQSAAATRLIAKECSEDTPGFVNLIVLCELVWVLGRGYRYSKKVVLSVLRQLLCASELRIERSELAWKAAREFEKGGADFSDYLIGYLNSEQQAELTWTFDRRAAAAPGFRLLA